MQISIIIPAFNEDKYIAPCLESILTSAPDALLEIIVVDNASNDHTAEIAHQFPRVRIVREEKKGLTKARQAGFIAAQGDLLAYLDADCRIPSFWFSCILSSFERDPSLVCVSGPYRYENVSLPVRWFIFLYWWIAFVMSKLVGYMAVGGNFVAKKESLIAIGGFDTSIDFYGEDTNIARRLSAQGKVRFDRSLFVWTSARRFEKEGFFKTGIIYILNFLSEVFLKRPVTKTSSDIR
jgi:glycosyltransferase involved in cell wall biosynthesis